MIAPVKSVTTDLPPGIQEYLLQARQMQALSFIVHIPLVCFGIAFPALILFIEWRYLRTGDRLYHVLARRWTRVLAALFAVGVITGTILSFEMGLLWPGFTGTFGGVFGLGFAIEGFSFFTEAIFIGIYIYGWDRFRPLTHFAAGIPVAIAGFTGSLTVIAVNGWMNHPIAFTLADGRVVATNPWQALFINPYFWHELVHMYIAGYMVTGFILAGAYAVSRLRGRWDRYHRTACAVPLTVAALAAPVQILVGDWAARQVATYQPIKLAALEGQTQTGRGVAEHLLGWYVNGEVRYGIAIPRLLSLLAFHNPNATVIGLDTVPPSQIPPVNVVRVAFQSMVGMGSLLALLGVVYLVLWAWRGRLPWSRWFYGAVVLAAPASFVALIAGWVTTEVGRQPWVVYKVMPTGAAVTGAAGIPVGYGALAAVYAGVVAGTVWILWRLATTPLPPYEDPGPSGRHSATTTST